MTSVSYSQSSVEAFYQTENKHYTMRHNSSKIIQFYQRKHLNNGRIQIKALLLIHYQDK